MVAFIICLACVDISPSQIITKTGALSTDFADGAPDDDSCPVDRKKAKVVRACLRWAKTEDFLSSGQGKGESGPRLPAVGQNRRFFVQWTGIRLKWTMPACGGPKQKNFCPVDRKKAKVDHACLRWAKTKEFVSSGQGKGESGPRLPAVGQNRRF
ncbi:MAG: hypothetical protein K6G29_05030, partial [Clostridiales bacterium]|nr:hypothetical protein [Clostridiales bacterium]